MPRIRTIAAGAVLLSSLLAGVATMAPPVNAAVTTTVPSRMLDTRNGIGRAPGIVSPGEVVRVTAPASVSAATSLALNLTAADALEPGFATVWACDEAKPATSNLNFVPGRAVANMAIIRPSASGNRQICLDTSAPVHLLVDLMAWFSGSGDVAPTAPNRIVDTRQTRNPLQVGEFRRVRVAGTSGVPANASSALLNVTLTGIRSAGFASVVPCPADRRFDSLDVDHELRSRGHGGGVHGCCAGQWRRLRLLQQRCGPDRRHVRHRVVERWAPGQESRAGVGHPQRRLGERPGRERRRGQGSCRGSWRRSERIARCAVDRHGVRHVVVRVRDGVAVRPAQARHVGAELLAGFRPGQPGTGRTLDGQWRGLSVGLPEQRTARRADRRRGRLRARKRQPGTRARSARSACSGSRSAWWFGWVRDVAGGCGVAVGCGVCVAGEGGGGDPSGERSGEWRHEGSRANANTRSDWSGFSRVDGDFSGTTDEIIQWAACKWGIDENIARAQVIKESYWYQSANGDAGESWGLGQVRDTAHQSAFQYSSVNARNSSAYNLDYTYAVVACVL